MILFGWCWCWCVQDKQTRCCTRSRPPPPGSGPAPQLAAPRGTTSLTSHPSSSLLNMCKLPSPWRRLPTFVNSLCTMRLSPPPHLPFYHPLPSLPPRSRRGQSVPPHQCWAPHSVHSGRDVNMLSDDNNQKSHPPPPPPLGSVCAAANPLDHATPASSEYCRHCPTTAARGSRRCRGRRAPWRGAVLGPSVASLTVTFRCRSRVHIKCSIMIALTTGIYI